MADRRTLYPTTPGKSADQRLAPSLIDRLIDRDPDLPNDPPISQSETMTGLRNGLRRDLEMLLNTRRRPVSPDPEWTQANDSLLTYGVEDFFAASLITTEQRDAFARRLRRAIIDFEPRLEDLSVTLISDPVPERRTLRLRISARYRAQPGLPPIVFETAMDPVAGRFTLADVRKTEAGRGQ